MHSTVHPETCIRLHRLGAEKGITVLDAPVSGGGPAAAQGTLLVMVGGDEAGLDRARPVLATFGDPILHVGDIGAGQTAKLVNNLVFTAQIALSLETFAFVDDLGLDRVAMAQVFERGSGASRAATMLSAPGFDIGGLGRVAGPLLRKDVNLITDVAARRQVAAPESVVTLAENGLQASTRRPRRRREGRTCMSVDTRTRPINGAGPADPASFFEGHGATPLPATAHAPPRTRHGWDFRPSPSGWTTTHGRCGPAPRHRRGAGNRRRQR